MGRAQLTFLGESYTKMRAGGGQTQPSCSPSCTHEPWHPATEVATQKVLEGKGGESWGVNN